MLKLKIKFKKTIITSASVLAFLIIIGLVIFYYQDTILEIANTVLGKSSLNTNSKNECNFIRKLDGVCVTNGQENLWPVAVMVDNHPDAWPQFGLNSAQIVYDTLVEGGATRFMAIYSTADEIKKIGPVRSARPYYLTWAKELNVLYGHSGGSTEAYERIKSWEILDCNEITSYGPLYFTRDNKFSAPHNLFTSSIQLNQARQDWKLTDQVSSYQTWQFSSAAVNSGSSAQEIDLKYSRIYPYDIKYEYNTSTQTYLRFQNQQPQIDALDKKQIEIKNLIFQFVPQEKHLDSADHLVIETLGSGLAWVFYDGHQIVGKWVKEKLSDRTIFYNETGKEVIFKPGNIWIEVIPGDKEISVK